MRLMIDCMLRGGDVRRARELQHRRQRKSNVSFVGLIINNNNNDNNNIHRVKIHIIG